MIGPLKFPTCILTVFIVCIGCVVSIKAERLPIKIYTSADGLGTSASFNVVRDASGFIWLCSRDGLVRFDGYRFINYRIGDESADPAVFDLLATRSGDYWINLNRGTDYKFTSLPDDRVVLPRTALNDVRIPFQAEPVRASGLPRFEDSEGVLWSASVDGIFKFVENDDGVPKDLIPIDLPGNPTGLITFIEFRKSRNGDGFWLGTNWGVVRRMRNGTMYHLTVEPNGKTDIVRPFAEDGNGYLWMPKPDGLVILKSPDFATAGPETVATINEGKVSADGTIALPSEAGSAVKIPYKDLLLSFDEKEKEEKSSRTFVSSTFVDSTGNVWLTTSQGLINFDGKRFRHITTNNGLATNDLNSITEGLDGSIWIVSYGGLHRLNPNGLISFDQFDGIARDKFHNILEDRSGNVVTFWGGFNVGRFDGRRFTTGHPKIPENEVYGWQSTTGFLDSRGDIWIYTNKKLYRFKNVDDVSSLDGRLPDETYDETNGLIGGNVLRMFEDSKGVLWFGSSQSTERRGVTRFDPVSSEFKNFLVSDGLPESAIPTGFADLGDGSLWFAFIEGGLARYRDGKFSSIESDTAPTAGLTGMYKDSKGRVWIATSREGVLMVEDPFAEHPVFKRFTTENGLTSNNIRCVTEDNFGNIYVGTVRGVNRFSPETGRVVYYGTSDGLASDFVNSIFRDRSGNIWIGTYNGLSMLTPRPDTPSEPPGIMISGLNIAGEDYAVSPLGQKEVRVRDIDAGKGNLQVEFLSAGSSFSSPARYQYRLNSNADWSQPSAEPFVNFASLPAGDFRFEVRAVSDDGEVSASPAFIRFTILRPVWQRWWFLLLAAIVISGIIYLIYRNRLAQLVKLERIRTRIASDLHDDIGSSLSQIAILSEVARQKAGESGVTEPLRRIADTSREMVDSMSDIVWAINPKKDTLGDLISRMRRFAEETFDVTEIGYKFDSEESQAAIHLGTDTRRDAYLIFKEAINNIVKHAQANIVTVSVLASGATINVEIKDDGVGYTMPDDPEQTFPGFGGNGLINMRRRAEERGGEFSFRSIPGEGTTVRFSLPTRAGTAREQKR